MALTNKLSAIGAAIREKTGGTELLTLDQMPIEIASITTGGDLTEEDRTFTGNISYLFFNGNFLDWQDKFPFILKDVTQMERMFENTPSNYDLSKIKITTQNYDGIGDGAHISSMFQNMKANSLPVVKGRVVIFNSGALFSNCNYLTDDKIRNFLLNPELELAWTRANNISSNTGLATTFQSCFSLRNISDILLYIHQYFRDNPIVYNSGSGLQDYYSNIFYNCYALDELCNIPILEFSKHRGNTSNIFSSAFSYCGRVKEFTFATDNGAPYTKMWKSQTIDLSSYIGYAQYVSSITGYNAGITADKRVTDDATYQALKNDPDWFTLDYNYSRYNHDSAVNTINSLPDTSAYLATAGGTNTIKFKGAAGSKTDGGAINTLTEEEIAVAVAKGWTVTFA